MKSHPESDQRDLLPPASKVIDMHGRPLSAEPRPPKAPAEPVRYLSHDEVLEGFRALRLSLDALERGIGVESADIGRCPAPTTYESAEPENPEEAF